MYGKLLGVMIGGMVGLAFSAPTVAVLLAAIGLVLGHRLDEGLGEFFQPAPLSKAAIEAKERTRFAQHLCELFVEVARADGELARDEVRVVREFFAEDLGFSPMELESVRQALKEAVATRRSIDTIAHACRDQLSPPERLLLLYALYELALVDGSFTEAEKQAIDRAAAGLEIPEETRRSVLAVQLGGSAVHYELLGLLPSASDEEVKAAYRKLAAAHHPDKVAHLGQGPVELATRRFRELKTAYDEIRELRGL